MRKLSRRNVLSAAGVVLGGTLLGDRVLADDGDADGIGAADWTQVQFDAAKTGHADATGPAGNLGPAWQFEDVGSYGVASAPAVVDGTIYFLSTGTSDGGSADGGYSGIVHAVDADGTERWRTRTYVAQSSVAVAGGLVFVGGRGGPLVALDAATGEQRWSVSGTPWFEGAPTIADGTLYVPRNGPQDGIVFALNAADGSEKWAIGEGDVGDLLGSPMSVTGVSVSDGVAHFAVGTDAGVGALYAVDAATGERRWRVDLPRAGGGTGNIATPTVADGRVFFATNNALFAFDSDGTERWREEIRGFTPRYFTEMSPAVADGTVYFPDGDGLAAVDAATGERRWTFEAPNVTVSSSPVVVDGAVYVGTEEAGAYALDATTGDPVGQYRPAPNAHVVVPPTVLGGTAYVGGYVEEGDGAPGLAALESGDEPANSAEPTPAFEVGPDEILRGMPVAFENTSDPFGDFDPESGDVEYRWDFTSDGEADRTSASADRTVEHTFEESGGHEVTLTVANSYGWTVSTTKSVEVSDEAYEAPTARIETEPPNAEERTFDNGDTVALDASASSGGARDIVSYEWDVDGYGHMEGEQIDVELSGMCGEWQVTLIVTDELGVSDETTIGLLVA